MFRALLHFSILSASLLLIEVAPALAQIYKWVDERGITHYGERPPQGGKASEVPDRLGSPGGVPPRTGAPPAAAAAPVAPEKSDDSRRREQCDAQRELLARLRQNQGDSRVSLERADAIARQDRLVAEQCKGL